MFSQTARIGEKAWLEVTNSQVNDGWELRKFENKGLVDLTNCGNVHTIFKDYYKTSLELRVGDGEPQVLDQYTTVTNWKEISDKEAMRAVTGKFAEDVKSGKLVIEGVMFQ